MEPIQQGLKAFFFALSHLFEPQIDLYHHFLTTVPYFISGYSLLCTLFLIIATMIGLYVLIKHGIPSILSTGRSDPGGFLPSVALLFVILFILLSLIEIKPSDIYDQAMYTLLWFGVFCYGYGAYAFVRRWSEHPLVFLLGAILAYLVIGLARIPWVDLLLTFLLFFWSIYSIGLTGIRVSVSCPQVKPEIGLSLAFLFVTGAIYQPLYIHSNYGTEAAVFFAAMGAYLAPASIAIGFVDGAIRIFRE